MFATAVAPTLQARAPIWNVSGPSPCDHLLLSSPMTFHVTGVTVTCALTVCAQTTQRKKASTNRRESVAAREGVAARARAGASAACRETSWASALLKAYSSSCLTVPSPDCACALLRGVPKRSKRFESFEEIVK